jgi:hypothetical protein
MKLLPDDLAKTIPALYGTDQDNDPMVCIKYFLPGTRWTWYVTEYDGENIFFGYVIGFEAELGYFTLSELEEVKGPLGFRVERDLYFRPQRLSIIKSMYRK